MSGKNLQHIINVELDSAVFGNKFTDLMTRTPTEVAEDLMQYSSAVSDLLDTTMEEVTACVKSYQEWYNTRPKE